MLIVDLVVQADEPISKALKVLDQSAQQIVFVVNAEGKFLGTVTDGDIRRGLLDRKSLSSAVSGIMNVSPLVLRQGESIDDIVEKAKQLYIKKIPILGLNDSVVNVYDVEMDSCQVEKDNAVVLMAGGLGTRLRPMTDSLPKPLMEVGKKPILQTIIENFRKYGIRKIFISVNYKSEMIKGFFEDGKAFGVEINYIEEKKRLGTAGALGLLDKGEINKPFFVMNGDLLTNVNFEHMLDYHIKQEAVLTVGVREYDFQVPYGVIKTKEGYMTAIDEKPVHSFFVNAGIYLLEPPVLEKIPEGEAYDMPALIKTVLDQSSKVSSFPVHEYWLDIGQIDQYNKANEDYKSNFSD